MQAVKGYLLNGWFTPIDEIVLPSQAEVVMVFGETTAWPQYDETPVINLSESEKQARIDWLNKIKKSLELSRGEDLSNFPPQGLYENVI